MDVALRLVRDRAGFPRPLCAVAFSKCVRSRSVNKSQVEVPLLGSSTLIDLVPRVSFQGGARGGPQLQRLSRDWGPFIALSGKRYDPLADISRTSSRLSVCHRSAKACRSGQPARPAPQEPIALMTRRLRRPRHHRCDRWTSQHAHPFHQRHPSRRAELSIPLIKPLLPACGRAELDAFRAGVCFAVSGSVLIARPKARAGKRRRPRCRPWRD